MAKNEIKLSGDPIGALNEFKRTTGAGGNGHGEFAAVIVSEDVKCNAVLAKVIDALNTFGAQACLTQCWEQQRGENGDDSNDDEQFDESEGADGSLSVGIHAQ
jgi:hypothetical protein